MSVPITLLPLSQYARIMGINPAHFFGLSGSDIFSVQNNCQDIWAEYSWQAEDAVSRYDVAEQLLLAEQEIANILGYHPAPKFIAQEEVPYGRFYRRDGVYGGNWTPSGRDKSVTLRWGKYIGAGERAVAEIDTGATVTYTDPDADSLDELATITATLPTAVTDITGASWYGLDPTQWIRAYVAGNSGAPEYVIPDPHLVTISGTTVTLRYWRWQLVDPTKYETYPSSDIDFGSLNIATDANFQTTVDVYLEYPDYISRSALLTWEGDITCGVCGGTGCARCATSVQEGCLRARNREAGIVVGVPATYNEDDSVWYSASFANSAEPDTLRAWYLSGLDWRKSTLGKTEVDIALAKAMAYLATARLERPYCHCGGARALADDLRMDLVLQSTDGGFVIVSDTVLNNPFGTKKGEVIAWQIVEQLSPKLLHAAVI